MKILYFPEIPGRVWIHIAASGGTGCTESYGRGHFKGHQKATENGWDHTHGGSRHSDSGAYAQASLWKQGYSGRRGVPKEKICSGPLQVES